MTNSDEANVCLLSLKIHGDVRGSLIALEKGNGVSFEIRRVYYIFNTLPNVTRGKHAHKNLRQLLVVTSGSVDIFCEWKGQKQSFHLDSPSKGLLIEGLVWREMSNFTSDAVLMVLANDVYEENEYIRNYDEFQKQNCLKI